MTFLKPTGVPALSNLGRGWFARLGVGLFGGAIDSARTFSRTDGHLRTSSGVSPVTGAGGTSREIDDLCNKASAKIGQAERARARAVINLGAANVAELAVAGRGEDKPNMNQIKLEKILRFKLQASPDVQAYA